MKTIARYYNHRDFEETVPGGWFEVNNFKEACRNFDEVMIICKDGEVLKHYINLKKVLK